MCVPNVETTRQLVLYRIYVSISVQLLFQTLSQPPLHLVLDPMCVPNSVVPTSVTIRHLVLHRIAIVVPSVVPCGEEEVVRGVHTLIARVVQTYHRLHVVEEEEKGRKVEHEVEREDQGEETTHTWMTMWMM